MAKCELCGEPMPEGERMFKFHGFSGPCPKPPLRARELPSTHVVAEFIRERRDDGFWIGIVLRPSGAIVGGEMVGPFETQAVADKALDDLTQMSLASGGINLPAGPAN